MFLESFSLGPTSVIPPIGPSHLSFGHIRLLFPDIFIPRSLLIMSCSSSLLTTWPYYLNCFSVPFLVSDLLLNINISMSCFQFGNHLRSVFRRQLGGTFRRRCMWTTRRDVWERASILVRQCSQLHLETVITRKLIFTEMHITGSIVETRWVPVEREIINVYDVLEI